MQIDLSEHSNMTIIVKETGPQAEPTFDFHLSDAIAVDVLAELYNEALYFYQLRNGTLPVDETPVQQVLRVVRQIVGLKRYVALAVRKTYAFVERKTCALLEFFLVAFMNWYLK